MVRPPLPVDDPHCSCDLLQEVLALASLAKKSLTLPGMQSDWEIDPDELEIARRPDGTEWRLGTGASAHVSCFPYMVAPGTGLFTKLGHALDLQHMRSHQAPLYAARWDQCKAVGSVQKAPITMICCWLKLVCLQQVYKAYRNGVQVVAVKIFTDQVPGDNQLRYAEAFRREIFILRSCHDRNIVQFLGACLQVRSHNLQALRVS